MKKIIALSILILTIPALALAGSTVKLPDYEKEAKKTWQMICDNGKTKVTEYQHRDYKIEIAVMESGYSFFELFHADSALDGYYIKSPDSNEVVKTEYGNWDKKLKEASENYYYDLHYNPHGGSKTDCVH